MFNFSYELDNRRLSMRDYAYGNDLLCSFTK